MASSNSPLSLPLQDRVTIVTGSSRGIGRAIALHLAQLGAKVVVNYISNSDQADQVAAIINSAASENSPRAIIVQADVSDPSQVKSLFDSAEKFFGSPVCIFVHSAGVSDSKHPTLSNTSLEDFDRTIRVNTRGSFLCCREAANRIKRGGGGRIVLLSSFILTLLAPGFSVYAASKAAIETMAKTLAKELKGSGITVNCVAPGPIATQMLFDLDGFSEQFMQHCIDECPLNRIGQPDDVAPIVGFLATDAGEWINGQVIPATGGHRQ